MYYLDLIDKKKALRKKYWARNIPWKVQNKNLNLNLMSNV
jgi:hypothetical protein